MERSTWPSSVRGTVSHSAGWVYNPLEFGVFRDTKFSKLGFDFMTQVASRGDFGDVRRQFNFDVGHYKAVALKTAADLNLSDKYFGDIIESRRKVTIEISLLKMAEMLREILKSEDLSCKYIDDGQMIMCGHTINIKVLDTDAVAKDAWITYRRSLSFVVTGAIDSVKAVIEALDKFPSVKAPQIFWNYLTEKRQEASVFMEEPRSTPDAFYPFIQGGLTAYFDAFMNSRASLLVMRGDPGTGKTTFIQNLIYYANLATMITYEERLFQSDEMFVEFMTNPTRNLLVMEDAETLLLSRERDNNSAMAKFLNVSDGLIRFKNKKIIITTNLSDNRSVDHALLRSGRCFDQPVFRSLNSREAMAAAMSVGIDFKPAPDPLRRYTLAEILCGPQAIDVGPTLGFRAA